MRFLRVNSATLNLPLPPHTVHQSSATTKNQHRRSSDLILNLNFQKTSKFISWSGPVGFKHYTGVTRAVEGERGVSYGIMSAPKRCQWLTFRRTFGGMVRLRVLKRTRNLEMSVWNHNTENWCSMSAKYYHGIFIAP